MLIVKLTLSQNPRLHTTIVEYLDYQVLVTQLKGPKGNADTQAAKRD